MRTLLIPAVAALLVLSAPAAQAWSEPPVKSQRDAACRDEARAKVFTAPNPKGLSLWDVGTQLYHACMAASGTRAGVATVSTR